MALKSKAQLKHFEKLVETGKMSKEDLKKHQDETPDISKLPDRLTPEKNTGVDKLRAVIKTKIIK